MIPVIMGFFLPLIVRGYNFKIADAFRSVSLANGDYASDVFLHGKQIWLYWAAFAALFLLLCFKLLERKIVYSGKWMIFGGIYLLGAFISALAAEDIKTAFFGGENMFQGFFVLLAYFILFYYTYMIFCGEKKQQTKVIILFLRCALALSVIMIILGVFQICGNDPFSWEWVQKLCNMAGARIVADKKIYLTLYNSNYVGVMTILLLPLLFTGMLVEKTRGMKIFFGAALLGTLGCLIASGSKTGVVILTIVIIIGCILVIVRSKKFRKTASLILAVVIVVELAIVIANKDTVLQVNQPLKQQKCNLTGMSTESDCLNLEVNGQQLSITWNGEGINFLNNDGTVYKTKKVSAKKKKQLMKKLPTAMTSYYGEDGFAPERVARKPFRRIVFFKSGFKYNGKNIRGYIFYINKQPYFITNEWDNGEYNYFNLSGNFVKIRNSEDAFDESVYGFASYRGYIWSKTIPLLKNTAFIGAGMDHFSLLFPNHDYRAKARVNGTAVIYNKPHNWYLQMGTESGIISLLGMIVMILYILIEGMRGIKKVKYNSDSTGEKDISQIFLVCLGMSIIGYCLMNVFNDQMIVTAPVFWLILGAYAGVSHCYKNMTGN